MTYEHLGGTPASPNIDTGLPEICEICDRDCHAPCEAFQRLLSLLKWIEDPLEYGERGLEFVEDLVKDLRVDGIPATSVRVAWVHHAKHGDIDGHTCLLGACALHYPKQ